jgi:DNA/RNA non-specific endonuclease
MKQLPCVLALLGIFASCSLSEDDEAADPVDDVTRLENEFGGADGLRVFFDENSAEVIQQELAGYGIGYLVHPYQSGSDDLQLISDCVRNFPGSDRNIWHNFNGELYFIDSSGRPSRAYADLPPIVAQARISSCQTSIGQWGDAENPSNDYDGGHLIGSQLGGWGGRANIVPQDANFNRGNWVQLENAMARCEDRPSRSLRYSVSVSYPNSSALVPSTFGMVITNRSSGSSVTMSFSNVDGGGSSGTATRQRGVAFLSSNGCN